MLEEIVQYPFLNKLLDDESKLNMIVFQKKTKLTFDKQIENPERFRDSWFYDCLTNVVVNEKIKLPI